MRILGHLREDLAWVGPPVRLTLLALSALIIFLASASFSVPGLAGLERQASDLRVSLTAPKRVQDKRILLITYNDDTLRATQETAPLDRTILAKALQNIELLKPKAIGIDMLFDQPQGDDDLLLSSLRELDVPVFLPFPDETSANAVDTASAQFVRSFLTEIGNPGIRFASTAFNADIDGTVRGWPDQAKAKPAPMAIMLAEAAGGGQRFAGHSDLIRFFVPEDRDQGPFANIPIDVVAIPDVAKILAESGEYQNRIILIGTDVRDYDRFSTPLTAGGGDTITGVQLQAFMVAQALDGARLRALPPWLNLLLAVAAFGAGIGIGSAVRRTWIMIPAVAVLSASWFAASFWWQRETGNTHNVAIIGAIAALAAGAWLTVAIRRMAAWEKGRTATLALHRYLPPDIAESIVTRPDRLGLQGETRDVFVMFTDLEGFTRLCQSVEAHVVAEFLNEYLEALSQVILAHGGTIDKFVGDAVIGFWGAPVARGDDGERALRAAIALLEVSRAFEGRDIGGEHKVGRTRIGLHYGSAIVGNFGGEGRLQYTALGDTMNVGARLESANKQLGTSILISGDVYAEVRGVVPCRSMGRVRVRGRSKPIAIFEPSLDLSHEQADQLNAFADAAMNGDAAALAALREWSASHPHDIAVAGLVQRLDDSDPDAATDLS